MTPQTQACEFHPGLSGDGKHSYAGRLTHCTPPWVNFVE